MLILFIDIHNAFRELASDIQKHFIEFSLFFLLPDLLLTDLVVVFHVSIEVLVAGPAQDKGHSQFLLFTRENVKEKDYSRIYSNYSYRILPKILNYFSI